MRRLVIGLLCGLLALPASGSGQSFVEAEVSWAPVEPVEGSIVVIAVRPLEPVRVVSGRLAREPLHFLSDTTGTFRALAGLPIGAGDTLVLPLRLERMDGSARTLTLRIPVARGRFAMERLAVAPEFGREPDSVTAARIEEETARALAVYRGAHRTPPLWSGAFRRPMGSRVTSGFGHGREFNGQIRSRHLGVDLDGARGAPVHSANRGVVALVGDFYYAGTVVYLDHGAGLVTAYMHLSRAEVAPGDTVAAGQLIGRVGATGRVTGPHLHWTARYGRVSVDPLSLLALEAGELPSAR